jgi:dTDP-4-amino-4,6-dideoxygalactose transaminase
MSDYIPFNQPYMTGRELFNIARAHFNGRLAGDGPYTARCHAWLENETGSARALLTHSCTAALEMTAMLADIEPGDEVIMPSFTFASTANAFVLRGGVPVFVDIREDTLNLDEAQIEAAITPSTRAIVPVHYAGVACEMDTITAIARRHGLMVIEDAAQGVMAYYKQRPLGTLGALGTYSFHETKNVISGEGGALLVNDPDLVQRAEIIREKGTDRSRFFRGEVDKYTWQEAGSSFLPGELIASFLSAQLDDARAITDMRLACWDYYHAALQPFEQSGRLRRPVVPADCAQNGHMYYILLPEGVGRDTVIAGLRARNVAAVFHYVPLHSAPAGMRLGRATSNMQHTNATSERLIRLPMWVGLTDAQQARVVEALDQVLPR